jgi:hypothetical protein
MDLKIKVGIKRRERNARSGDGTIYDPKLTKPFGDCFGLRKPDFDRGTSTSSLNRGSPALD